MTHHPIKVLEDGTRVYSNGTRYTPVPPEKRKHQPRKPPVPGALRMGAVWYEPLVLLPGDQRLWPETVPDEEAYDHAFKPRKRKHQPRKPPVPGALRMGAVWFEPLVLLPADERLWPETVPDEEAYDHAFKPRKCKCLVCKRPAARKWRRRGLAHKRMGLSNTSSSDEGPPSSR